jgi:2-dehydro-3-deoxygluconokinase
MTVDPGRMPEPMAAFAIEVVTLGECMVSFVALDRGPLAEATHFLRTIAGSEANVAVGLARLGHRVAYIGRVGADGLGTAVVRELRGQGVDVGFVREDPDTTTGIMIRELRDLGPAEVGYRRTGSAGSRLAPEDLWPAGPMIDAARWLHVTGITPALSPSAAATVDAAIDRAAGAGIRVSMDVNLRRRLWSEDEARPVLVSLARRASVVLGGVDELAVVAGAETFEAEAREDAETVARAVLDLGPERVVVKLGAAGALEIAQVDGRAVVTGVEAHPIPRIVDPVGAGDAFCAGYIAAMLDGLPTPDVLAWANACGAAAASTLGDQAGMPTRAELERLLTDGGPDTLR